MRVCLEYVRNRSFLNGFEDNRQNHLKDICGEYMDALTTRPLAYENDTAELPRLAREIRRKILDICYRSGSSHIGPSFSIVEILVALYFDALSVSPENPGSADRDRFILSKGHACPALYATLYHKGFITEDVLNGFAQNGGTLEHHPSRNVEWGIEVSTGSLGYGLSIATGMALSARLDSLRHRIFVLLSDGEMNEGTTWEAAMLAGHHGLDNVVAIVDYNKMQALGRTSEIVNLAPLAEKWASLGWAAKDVDGHDINQLVETFSELPLSSGRPTAIIAHTVKGKGVSFMENQLLWHYRCPNREEYEKAMEKLS